MAYPSARNKDSQPRQTQAPANSELKPMKGVFLPLTERHHEFITKALHDIGQVYSDERHEHEAADVVADLLTGKFDDPSGLTWQAASDKFGDKVYTNLPFAITGQQEQKGELRVTVPFKKDGTLSLDIRIWGKY